MINKSIDELEVLTPEYLRELLFYEIEREYPDFQYIEDILHVGCPVDARSIYGRTLLYWASGMGKLEIVELFLSRGANINAKDFNGQVPLHAASFYDKLEVLRFLITFGADVHIRDMYDKTPWDYATNEIRKAIPELEPK